MSDYTLTKSQQGELELALIESAAVLRLVHNYLMDRCNSHEDEGLPEAVAMVRHRLSAIAEAVTASSFEKRSELAAKGVEADLL